MKKILLVSALVMLLLGCGERPLFVQTVARKEYKFIIYYQTKKQIDTISYLGYEGDEFYLKNSDLKVNAKNNTGSYCTIIKSGVSKFNCSFWCN